MALLYGTVQYLGGGPSRIFGQAPSSITSGFRSATIPHTHLNWGAGEHRIAGVTDRGAVPEGARHPVAWKQPRKAGGLASRNAVNGSGTATGAMAAGKNAEAALTGSGVMAPAPLQLVVSAVAALAGSGAIGTAGLAGKIEAAAALAGSGAINAAVGALAGIFADLGGTGAIVSTMRALGFMEAEVTPFTELSPQSLAAAVMAAAVEEGLTVEGVLRLLLAQATGDATGLDGGTIAFKSVDGTKTRVGGTVVTGTRTVTIRDAE